MIFSQLLQSEKACLYMTCKGKLLPEKYKQNEHENTVEGIKQDGI